MLGWLLCAALLVVALTFLCVGVIGHIARTRAVMAGGFWSRGKHYTVVEDAPEEDWDYCDGVVFSPALDHEHRGNIDRWRV